MLSTHVLPTTVSTVPTTHELLRRRRHVQASASASAAAAAAATTAATTIACDTTIAFNISRRQTFKSILVNDKEPICVWSAELMMQAQVRDVRHTGWPKRRSGRGVTVAPRLYDTIVYCVVRSTKPDANSLQNQRWRRRTTSIESGRFRRLSHVTKCSVTSL